MNKILKVKDRKDKDSGENMESKDIWKDLKANNIDLTNLLSELDKAIEGGEKSRHVNSRTSEVGGNEGSECKTEKSVNLDNEASQASPNNSVYK